MALCAPVPCGCSITSTSLSITGNGAPWNIETYEGIATEVPDTRPGAGQRFDGMRVYTTDTNRLWIWRADLGAWEPMYDPATPWIDVSFTNSWVNYDPLGAGARNVMYRKVIDKVELRGVMKNGTLGASAFNLPAGYRPPYTDQTFVVDANAAFGALNILSSGNVVPGGSNAFIYLDGINFSVTA